MTSTASNRRKFITGLINFMENYGFDGVDLDWEYPQADDRGGVTADKANYVSLAKELKAAFGTFPTDTKSAQYYPGWPTQPSPVFPCLHAPSYRGALWNFNDATHLILVPATL